MTTVPSSQGNLKLVKGLRAWYTVFKKKEQLLVFYLVDEIPREDAAAAAKSLQSCPTLCDPIDSSPPDFPVSGILQARTLEWVAISFSNA